MDGSCRGAPHLGVFTGKKKKKRKVTQGTGPAGMEQGSLAVHTSHWRPAVRPLLPASCLCSLPAQRGAGP